MMPSDETLLDAVREATLGRKVVFLTSDRKITDHIVKRALDSAIQRVARITKAPEGEIWKFFKRGSSDWHWLIESSGSLFFFPAPELEDGDSLGDPNFIYCPYDEDSYMKYTNKEWLQLRERKPLGGLTFWDRLLED